MLRLSRHHRCALYECGLQRKASEGSDRWNTHSRKNVSGEARAVTFA